MIKDIFQNNLLFKQNIPVRQSIQQIQDFNILELIEENKKNFFTNNWTESDQIKLIELHNSLGNKWAEIAKQLQKSDNAVKNYFHSKLRKGLRCLNRKVMKFFKGYYRVFKCAIISKILQTMQEQRYQYKQINKGLVLLCFCKYLSSLIEMKNKLYQEANKKQNDQLSTSSVEQIILKLIYINKALKKKPRRYQKLTLCFKKKPRKLKKIKQQNNKKKQQSQICKNQNNQNHDQINNLKTSIEIEQFREYNLAQNIQPNMQQFMLNYAYFQNFNYNGYYFLNPTEEIINYQPFFIYYNYQYFQKQHEVQNSIYVNPRIFSYNSSIYNQFVQNNRQNKEKSDYVSNPCTFQNYLDYYN